MAGSPIFDEASPSHAVRTYGSADGWLSSARAWWRRGGRRPLVLRRVSPPGELEGATVSSRPDLDEIGAVIAKAALERPGGLMNAYVASAIDVALQAEALADGAPSARVRTPVHDLVNEVVEALQRCATAAGAKLLHDRDTGWACAVSTDAGRMRKALSHLVLRAVTGHGRGGAVRIMVTADPETVRIAVVPIGGGPDPGLFDLAGLTRLVHAIGGELEAGPPWAGCTPLTLVFPVQQAPVASFAPPTPPDIRQAAAGGGRL